KMIYGEEASAGKSVVVVDVEKQERQQFALNDHELQELAKQALIIESHSGSSMEIEWAKDGDDGQIYIVQARPETVKCRDNVGTME
ncbi:phosphoenolpyruvate synthase, partial [bacterium LRH843]|nr:phosphoenolpyruvate synthase [bacterium LRH843]